MDKFVLQVPKWQGELLFSKEIILFLGVILLMIVGTLFCFWGYKYFRTVLFLGIGVVVCYGSYLLVEPMTANLVIRMFLTVSLTFLGMCFVYFLNIVFSYVLDRLRIRSALGKRAYLLTAPLGAAILGLVIYFYIWRDAVVTAGITLCCLTAGLVFQYRKRKKMVRFRCYNDLLRLRRPRIDEDGLEILSVGAAPLASVSSVLAAAESEPVSVAAVEPEPEPVPVFVPELEPEPAPEPGPEPVFEPEPEPVFAVNAGLRALSEIESEFAAKPESGIAARPAQAVEETEAKPAPAGDEMEARPVRKKIEAEPVPVEISESVRDLLLRKMETDEELLEEAFFVKQVSRKMAEKKREKERLEREKENLERKARKKEAEENEDKDIRIEKIAPVYPGKIRITGKDRKSRRKWEEGVAKAAAVTVAGLGAFIAGRVSKGGD